VLGAICTQRWKRRALGAAHVGGRKGGLPAPKANAPNRLKEAPTRRLEAAKATKRRSVDN